MSWQVRTRPRNAGAGYGLYNVDDKRWLYSKGDATSVSAYAAMRFETPGDAKRFRHENKLAKAGK